MPLYDFECKDCRNVEEQIVSNMEPNPHCSRCGAETTKLIGRLADWTGINSMTVQYATQSQHADRYKDSHITKIDKKDSSFLRKSIKTVKLNDN